MQSLKENSKKKRLEEVWKEKDLIIFDFDGTLLDSMPMWGHIGTEYIISQGITPPPDLEERLISMTLEQSGQFYIKELGLKKTVEEYMQDILQLVDHKYRCVLELKPGAAEFLRLVSEHGKKICILTTTIHSCVEAAVVNRGLDRWISPDRIFTCSEIGMSKTSPDIYCYTVKKMGSTPERSLVFEDAPFAIRSAKQAGCTVCAVYDASAVQEAEMIKEWSDFEVNSFIELTD